MARFAGILRHRAERPISFLVLSPSDTEALVALLAKEGFERTEVICRSVPPAEMSEYLSVADVGLSFIRGCFSKKGSSPTKVAEYLACGLAVALNGDVGDQLELAADRDACVVLDSLGHDELLGAADRVLALVAVPAARRASLARRVAEQRFGLERVGIPRYERLYRAMVDRGATARTLA
jgi:glycosyltransferase involved in cell wall biosynthesis